MLEKTLALLRNISPGTYVPDAEKCYDDQEIEALGALLRRIVWAPSQLRKKLQESGINLIPRNFYSEIPSIHEIEQSFVNARPEYDYIFDDHAMAEFLDRELFPFSEEFDPPVEWPERDRFYWRNPAFSFSDAMSYYCFIRHAKPRTILEVGSGWSTLVADAACKANGVGRIICVEPFPPEFLAHVASPISIVKRPVQELEISFFNDALASGDILFIDSTHTVKHASDCLHLYLKILPRLSQSLFVHVHDVYLPRTVPLPNLRDRHIYWTEQYLVMAYLIDNRRTKVLYGSSYHFEKNREKLKAFMRNRFMPGGGSLWFTQSST